MHLFNYFRKTVQINAKLPTQNRIGRGGKIVVSRSTISPKSVSSNESEAETVPNWGKRLQIIQESNLLKQNAKSTSIQRDEILADNTLVAITAIVDHKTIFLRSFETKDNVKYLKYLNDVLESSKTAMPLNQIPKTGDIVLAEFQGAYYRAVVAQVEEDYVVVAFVEFGNLEKMPLSNLKELRADLKYMKQFIFKAHLPDLNADLKSDQCLVYLHDLLADYTPLKFIGKEKTISSKGILCELRVSSTNESVNGMVNKLNSIKPDNEFFVSTEVISCLM